MTKTQKGHIAQRAWMRLKTLKGVRENLHPRRFSTREQSTREAHVQTCEGGPKPTHFREASKRQGGPLGREKGTEHLSQVPIRPLRSNSSWTMRLTSLLGMFKN